MKILQPHRISSEILEVIYQSNKNLTIVSPYVNFSNWRQMADALANALKRGVSIDFFVRSDSDNTNSWEQVEQIGIIPKLVENLHAKFYFNEKMGVISSMNLLSYSNSNSIEIGCKLETNEEINELKRFVNDFLLVNEIPAISSEQYMYLSKERFSVILENYIHNITGTRTSVYFKNGSFVIFALSNKYFLDIDRVNNLLFITAIISKVEADKFDNYWFNNLTGEIFEIELNRGEEKHYDLIEAAYKTRLSYNNLDKLKVDEKLALIVNILSFISEVRKFKDFVHQ